MIKRQDDMHHGLNTESDPKRSENLHTETENFLEITPKQLERTFRTNLFSFFWTAQNAVPHMRAGDSIINVASDDGRFYTGETFSPTGLPVTSR